MQAYIKWCREVKLNIFPNPIKSVSKITKYEITKRQRFILMSFFLTAILIAAQTVSESVRYQVMVFLAFATTLLAVFALWGELSGLKYFLLLLLPVYFVTGATLFYFLLPVRWITRLPFALAFGISVYLLMLTSNIYNVAAIRTIALLRAAHAVGHLFSLVATFFLLNVLFSLHLSIFLTVAGVVAVCGPIYLVNLWSFGLEDYITQKVFGHTVVFTLVTAQVASVFAFWPLAPINASLVVITAMYVLLGLGQFVFHEKLKPRIVWEHLSVALVVAVIIMISSRWGG